MMQFVGMVPSCQWRISLILLCATDSFTECVQALTFSKGAIQYLKTESRNSFIIFLSFHDDFKNIPATPAPLKHNLSFIKGIL